MGAMFSSGVAAGPPVVLVTGCSKGGIGYELCKEFARHGCTVYATARRLEAMAGLDQYGDVKLVRLDVTDAGSIAAAMAAVTAGSGRLDILVNNAGVMTVGPQLEADMAETHAMYEANVFGALAMAQAAGKLMVAQRSGKILNVGSIAGMLSTPFLSVYSSTKAALLSLTDGLRLELKPFGVQVTYVAPGIIQTELARNMEARGEAAAQLPAGSPYAPLADKVTQVSAGVNAKGATPVDKFARKLVATALQRRAPRMFSFGQHARIVMFAAAWFPVALRDALLYADYKLKRLERSRLGVTAAGVEKKAQ